MEMQEETKLPLTVSPVNPQERIQLIDVLRGFALFGVLTANIWLWFSGIAFLFPDYLDHLRQWNADAVVNQFVTIFISGKFITIFSFLFGLGFAIQLGRAEERGVSMLGLYSRRLAALLTFGVLHGVLLWYGDILVVYALIGFTLLVFRRRSEKALLVWAGVFLIVIPLILGSIPLVSGMFGAGQPDVSRMIAEREQENAAALLTYSQGSYPEMVATNLKLLQMFWLEKAFRFVPMLFGLFLLGMWAGRRGLFRNIEENRALFQNVFRWGLPVGLVVNVGLAVLALEVPPAELYARPALVLLFMAGMIIGTFPLAFSYVALITRLFQDDRWRRRLLVLAPVGRMALTNYLSQTVFCLLIFYGFGLGWIGRVGPALCLAIAIAVYAVQIPVSRWWLRNFRFGPMEWLWRSITYAGIQPMRPISTEPELGPQPAAHI